MCHTRMSLLTSTNEKLVSLINNDQSNECAAGVSGLYADDWRRIMGSKLYGTVSADLRKAVTKMTRKIWL